MPMLVSGAVGAADLELARDAGERSGRLPCLAINPLGDELVVLELALDPNDDECAGTERPVPEAGPGSFACSGGRSGGKQQLQGTVDVVGRPESVYALFNFAEPRYDDDGALLPQVADSLTRSIFGVTDQG